MLARISSAVSVHTKGSGLVLWASINARMAVSSSTTLRCTPRRTCLLVSSANHRDAGAVMLTTNRNAYAKVLEFYDRFEARKGFRRLGYGRRISQRCRLDAMATLVRFDGASVLDVGCGLGDLLEYFRAKAISYRAYTGIDVSGKIIAEARKRWGKTVPATFEAGDIFSVKKPYDWVLA